jgi:hypothetical protein
MPCKFAKIFFGIEMDVFLLSHHIMQSHILSSQYWTAAHYANQVVDAAKLAAWLSPSLLPFF